MSSSTRNAGTDRSPAPWGTPPWRDDVVHRYVVKKHPIRRIAADLGCSYGTVHRVLRLAQVPMRPRGGANNRNAATTPSTRRSHTTPL